MKYVRTILLGGLLLGSATAFASPQVAIGVQWRGGGYGGYNYGGDSARRFGFEDGLNDGRRDRFSGHSFRPTHDSSYRHADRGYNRSFGNRDYYKQAYREAYERGYREGYNSRGGGWRR